MAAGAREADILEIIGKEVPGPLYFFFGKERFLVDRAVDLVRQKVLDPATRDFNYDLLQGKDATAAKIVQAARTLPMMAKRRLVLVRDADEMKADELNGLISYVSQPCPETCLVFTAEKADQRIKFFSAYKKKGVLAKLDPLYENKLPGFVEAEARARGVALDGGVARLIADEIGADLAQLSDAVERLSIYAGERKKITAADVDDVVATTRQRNVFELCNAVGQGNRARALTALSSMLGARESGVRIVAMLARHTRQLWTAQSLLARRMSKYDLASALGVPPFFIDDIAAQAQRLDGATLKAWHGALYDADKNLKSSRLSDERILEGLILALTKPRPGGERRA
jgi:DNA polymerase-3 subunit delta